MLLQIEYHIICGENKVTGEGYIEPSIIIIIIIQANYSSKAKHSLYNYNIIIGLLLTVVEYSGVYITLTTVEPLITDSL